MIADDGLAIHYSLKSATECSANCDNYELVSDNERYCVSNCTTHSWPTVTYKYIDGTTNKTCIDSCPEGRSILNVEGIGDICNSKCAVGEQLHYNRSIDDSNK